MSGLRLIAVYAGYGDTLLLQTPDTPPQYWLIDGGPVSPFPSRSNQNDYKRFAYYQFLKRALRRFCMNQGIITLSGIIVSHPHKDHVAGLIQLIKDWLPDPGNAPSQDRPLHLQGPVIMNATCLKRPLPSPKPLYDEEPYQLVLAQVLADKHFRPSLITQNSNFFPASMKNVSLADCYAMTLAQGAGSYALPPSPWKADPPDIVGLDPSSINRRSILTMWTEAPGQQLRLVTTGDALAFDILPRMEEIEKGSKLGIFKVPHHGSQLNSQSEENFITENMIEKEKDHVFLLAMLVEEYIFHNPNPNTNNVRLQAVHDDNLGEPQSEWNANPKTPKPFLNILKNSSEAICQYLGNFGFRVTASVPPIDLSTRDGRTRFAIELAEREARKKASLLNSADGKVKEEPYLIEFVESDSATVGKKTKLKLQTVFDLYKRPLDGELASLGSLRSALFANDINSLHIAKFVTNFYKSFTATNYIISANGQHGHPNASTIAGIMAACLKRPKPPFPARLFVTSGYSVQLDYVRNIVNYLMSTATTPPTLTPPQWADWIKLFYMDDDYLMSVPVDNSPVSECKEIIFPPNPGTPQGDFLTRLHEQFQSSGPYGMPRAAVSSRSTFHIVVRASRAGPDVGYLSINANNDLELVTTIQPLFIIEHRDYGPGPNQRPTFKLRLYNNPNLILAPEVIFNTMAFGTYHISTVGPPPMKLCYDSTQNNRLWFDANAAANMVAYVVTKRVDELPR